MTGERLAEAALLLVGVPFRLHGRDPETGLDCVGLLATAMAQAGRPVPLPNNYSLRSRHLPELGAILDACGLSSAQGAFKAGDVLMLRPSPCQFHLAIASDGNHFVHAHAGLMRVVLGPGPLPWPLVGHWRLHLTV